MEGTLSDLSACKPENSLLTVLGQGGRELAEVSRPNTKEPPIMILSDGTVF